MLKSEFVKLSDIRSKVFDAFKENKVYLILRHGAPFFYCVPVAEYDRLLAQEEALKALQNKQKFGNFEE